MKSEPCLRDRKKRLTRDALSRAAVTLAAERGLDHVTVEDISAAADVSARTFFNYFGIPPRDMGEYAGLFGAVFGVGTVAGRLIGGVMVDTSWLGWRWCFFIGVPFTLASIFLLQRTLRLPVVRQEVEIDWLGAALIVSGVSTLLVWTTLAGNQFEWLSGWSALMVVGGLVLLALAVWVESRAADPIVPLSIFANRTVSLTTLASALVGVAMFGGTVFLSQYFQVGLGKTPTQAGLMSLPLILGLLVSSAVAGGLITKWGRWKVFLVAGGVVMVGGMLLLATVDARTSVFMVSVHMAVLGVGVGVLMQNLVLVAQNDVPAKDLGATTSTLTFFRSLGGAIGVSVLGAVLANRVTGLSAEKFGPPAGGSNEVPDLSKLPREALVIIQDICATATAELFLIGRPSPCWPWWRSCSSRRSRSRPRAATNASPRRWPARTDPGARPTRHAATRRATDPARDRPGARPTRRAPTPHLVDQRSKLCAMTRPAGLRERKKLATRTALADAALRLCLERGVDGVTVEQVAHEAGVSLRTFFNYFSSKEEAVVAGDVATAEAFVRAFADRPEEEPVLEALRRALVDILPEHVDRAKLEQLRLLRRTPTLLPAQLAAFHAQERALAGVVGERVGVDPAVDLYPMMFAATVMASVRVVVTQWLDTGDQRPLVDLVNTMIDQLAAGFRR